MEIQHRTKFCGSKPNTLFVVVLVLAGSLGIAACVTSSANSVTHPVVGSGANSAGSVQKQINVAISASNPSVLDQGSSPNLAGFGGSVFVSRSGFMIAAEGSANESRIFLRAQPLASWTYLGSIPGVVAQLDYASLMIGFALVQAPNSNVFSSDVLYSTLDGGRHWTRVSAGNFNQVHFFDSQSGIALSSSAGGPNAATQMLMTDDGGYNWMPEPSSVFANANPFGTHYVSFSFISRQVGWLAFGGEPGAGNQSKWLFRTVDGGTYWTQVAAAVMPPAPTVGNLPGFPIGGYLEQVRFVGPAVGYMVLSRGGTGGALKTVDGGVNWAGAELFPGNDVGPTSISNLTPTTPYGGIAVTSAGSVWNQGSGGGNWKRIYPPYRALSIAYHSGSLGIVTAHGRVLELATSNPGSPKVLGDFGLNTGSINLESGKAMLFTSNGIEIYKTGNGWFLEPYPTGWHFLTGRFENGSVGIAVRTPRTDAVEVTVDAGKNWENVTVPFLPFSVDPLGANDWWMIGVLSTPLVPNPYNKDISVRTYSLYHTTNAGKSWTQYKSGWGSQSGLMGVRFVSSSDGYAWNQDTIFVTKDGGATFVSQKLPDHLSIPNTSGFTMGTGGQAWIALDSYPIFETTDYGSHWKALG